MSRSRVAACSSCCAALSARSAARMSASAPRSDALCACPEQEPQLVRSDAKISASPDVHALLRC